ncbi:MAG: glycosyltransferase family 4 protein, partial [Bacteroidetes bacterium]|nr:glycosyltransferase family 4 protein [Bacteroidota bacterium]
MRIAVNTRLLIKNKLEGVGWFTHETLRLITVQHPEHEFYFLFDRDYDNDFIFSDNITPIIIGPQARHPFLYYLWFEKSVPAVLKKLKIDLFLSPDGYLSLRSKIPSINVIHDLNFEHHPNDYPFAER